MVRELNYENHLSVRKFWYFILSKTIENETKEQRERFLSMLLGTLGASLLGNLLTGKGIMRAGDGIVRAGIGSKKKN